MAFDSDPPLHRLNNAAAGCKSETRPPPFRFCREKRLEDPLPHLAGHSRAAVGDVEKNKVSSIFLLPSRFDPYRSMRANGIARVENEIDEHLLDFTAIGGHAKRPIPERDREFHILGQQTQQHGLGVFHNSVQILDNLILGAITAEDEELSSQRCGTVTGVFNLQRMLAQPRVPAEPRKEEPAVGHNDCENVVVVVRQASGEFAENLEFLRAAELVAQGFPVPPKRHLVQCAPHGGGQSREAVLQNVIGGPADGSRNDEEWNIRRDLPRKPEGLETVATGKRKIRQHKIEATKFERP